MGCGGPGISTRHFPPSPSQAKLAHLTAVISQSQAAHYHHYYAGFLRFRAQFTSLKQRLPDRHAATGNIPVAASGREEAPPTGEPRLRPLQSVRPGVLIVLSLSTSSFLFPFLLIVRGKERRAAAPALNLVRHVPLSACRVGSPRRMLEAGRRRRRRKCRPRIYPSTRSRIGAKGQRPALDTAVLLLQHRPISVPLNLHSPHMTVARWRLSRPPLLPITGPELSQILRWCRSQRRKTLPAA